MTPAFPEAESGPGQRWAALVILAVAGAAGVWLRLSGVDQKLFFGDELHTVGRLHESWWTVFTTYDFLGSGTVLPLLQKASAHLFGADELTLRLPAVIPGILSIPLFYPLMRQLYGSLVASTGVLLLAVSHFAVFHARNGRIYSLSLCIAIVLTLLVLRMAQGMQRGQGAAVAGLSAFAVWCHPANGAFVLILGVYLFATLVRRKAGREQYMVWLWTFGGGCFLSLLLFLPTFYQVAAFGRAKVGTGMRVDAGMVMRYLSGGGLNAVLFFILAPLGMITGLLKRAPHRGLVTLTIALGVAVILVVRPYGIADAYARYLIFLVPFLLIAVLDGLVAVAWCVQRVVGGRVPVAAVVAVVFAGVYWAVGYEGARRDRHSGFIPRAKDFTLVDMAKRLPWASPAYDDIGRDSTCRRVVEFPYSYWHSIEIYFWHHAIHGKDIYMGAAGDTGEYNRYVNILDLHADWGSGTRLIIHKNIAAESRMLADHLRIQPEIEQLGLDPGDFQPHADVRPMPWIDPEGKSLDLDDILRQVVRQYGPGMYEDEWIVVFRIPDRVNQTRY